ncbi:MAG: FapA family protein [Angelakisella sp.]
MEKISNSSDPKQTRSLLFRLFSGEKGQIPEETSENVTDVQEPAIPEIEEVQQAISPETNVQNSAEVGEPEYSMEEYPTQEGFTTPTIHTEDGEPIPVDAGIEIRIMEGSMEAYVSLTPPQNGGAEAIPKNIRAALKDAGVTYGILDRVMFDIAISKPYNKGKILVAQGTDKEDGADGQLVELFPKEIDVSPHKNADGTVDFKQLSSVREIKAGSVISYLIPPTEGTDGMNVKGEVIKCKPGKPKQLMRGINTILSEDGLQLLAGSNGHLVYRDGRFNVDTTFVVSESVDNNTGNITFCGDVLIKGDVREGYVVRSGGSVKVKGVVEGGSIYAEGDICIDGGFNGMKRGELETKKSVISKFLQNGNIRAKENITSEAVINSIISCDGQLNVTKNKGVIVGGRCTVLHSVEAKVIGSDVNTPTQITVGLSPTILAEKQELEKSIAEVDESKDMLNKNLIYLERCAKMGKLSDKNMALQESCNKQKVLIMVREARYRRQLETVNATIEEAAAGSMVKAQTVYPSTKVSIKSQSVMTKTEHQRCVFRIEKGELIIGTY